MPTENDLVRHLVAEPAETTPSRPSYVVTGPAFITVPTSRDGEHIVYVDILAGERVPDDVPQPYIDDYLRAGRIAEVPSAPTESK